MAEIEAIYERHGAAILRYVRRRLGDGPAEDAAAEVFARALTARFDGANELPWLYGIAAHVIADLHRAERRRLKALERAAAEPRRPGEPADPLDAELARALRKLSRGDREALLLVVWGELSYEETAVALGVPIGTVRSRIARARRNLSADAGGWRGQTVGGESHG